MLVRYAPDSGLAVARLISAATTNATSVKTVSGVVFGWHVTNVNAAARYFKLYNKASAPTVGTDTPFMTIVIPAASHITLSNENGFLMATGIAYALTTGIADADTGAVSAAETSVNLFYK